MATRRTQHTPAVSGREGSGGTVVFPFVLALCVCIVFSSGRGNGRDNLSRHYPTQDKADVGGLSYMTGAWPQLKPLNHDPSLFDLEKRMNELYNPPFSYPRDAKPRRYPVDFYLVSKFASPYFRSEYSLVYFRSCMNMTGMLPPSVHWFARRPGAYDFFSLDSFKVGFRSLWPPDEERRIRYLVSDARMSNLDDDEAKKAIYDVITLASSECPLVFLNDVFEVYQISNTLGEDLIWTQYANLDTIATLLTSFRLFDIGANEYIVGNYQSVSIDSSDFEPYRDVVKPPYFAVDSLGCHHGTVFTWTPNGGRLVKWTVSISRKGELTIIKRLVVAPLGYRFRWA